MATGTYAPDPDLRVVDANGYPVSGGLVWTYLAGTSTPAATYTDVNLTVPNSNPIVAGSDGRFVAFLALNTSYKFVYEMPATPPAHGAVIATRDNIMSVPSVVPGVVQTTNLTGTQHDFPLTPGCSLLRCSGAATLTLTGLAAGTNGQLVTIQVIGGGDVYLAHNTGSVVGNRFMNWVTSGLTPLASATYGNGGTATYVYDAYYSEWRLVQHEMGGWLPEPFNAANYGANGGGTWSVGAAAVPRNKFTVAGKTMHWAIYLSWFSGSNTVSGTVSSLTIRAPGGLTPGDSQACPIALAAETVAGSVLVSASAVGVNFQFSKANGTNWTAGGAAGIITVLSFEVV